MPPLPEYFRCDLADYAAIKPRCVFHHVPSWLRVRATDTRFAESAELIRDAQTDITLTKPGIIGKKSLDDDPFYITPEPRAPE